MDLNGNAHDGLVEEGEALQALQRVGGGGDVRKDDPRLTPQLVGFSRLDFGDLAKLGEKGVEALLELCSNREQRK